MKSLYILYKHSSCGLIIIICLTRERETVFVQVVIERPYLHNDVTTRHDPTTNSTHTLIALCEGHVAIKLTIIIYTRFGILLKRLL